VCVTLLSDDAVRTLAGFRSAAAPVTSCYLDVDGRRLPTHQELDRSFARLVREAGINGRTPGSVVEDVRRMARHVRGLERGWVRGVAMFSCAEAGLWETYALPVPVASQLVVEPVACVRPLEALLETCERVGVLLADRQRARMFVAELGTLVDHSERWDEVVREGEDDRGERVKTRQASQLSEQQHQHLRQAARLAFDVYQRVGFDHLVVGAPVEVQGPLEQLLHPYLRERLAERTTVPVQAPDDVILRTALDVAQRIERRQEADLVVRLRDALGARARAVAGLPGALRALGEHRVEVLLVSQGYAAEGWLCPGCTGLAVVGRRCPSCTEAMDHVPDVVEIAVARALANHARVEVLVANPDLDVLGGIGALLRY
jgi:peptide chain release factor subunit 1